MRHARRLRTAPRPCDEGGDDRLPVGLDRCCEKWATHVVPASRSFAPLGRVSVVLRRLAFAPLVLITVAVVTYGMPRALRPEFYRGQGLWSGLGHDLNRVFLHF